MVTSNKIRLLARMQSLLGLPLSVVENPVRRLRSRLPDGFGKPGLPGGRLREGLSPSRVGARRPFVSGDLLSGPRLSSVSEPTLPVPDEAWERIDGVGSPLSRFEDLSDGETTSPEYFVGIVPESHETVRERLADSRLGVSYASYPKHLPDEELECLEKSSWVYRSWSLSHFQLHVVLFEAVPAESDRIDGPVYVFCHHEPNWLRHPVRHLRRGYLNPAWGRNLTVELLESCDLPVYTCGEINPGGEHPGDEHTGYQRAWEYCRRRGEGS